MHFFTGVQLKTLPLFSRMLDWPPQKMQVGIWTHANLAQMLFTSLNPLCSISRSFYWRPAKHSFLLASSYTCFFTGVQLKTLPLTFSMLVWLPQKILIGYLDNCTSDIHFPETAVQYYKIWKYFWFAILKKLLLASSFTHLLLPSS